MTAEDPEEALPEDDALPEPALPEEPFLEEERSPYAPSLTTKLLAVATAVIVFGGGLLYSLRYELGLVEGHYSFMVEQRGSGDPVTYPACRPISYAVTGRQQLRDGQQLIDEAVAAVVARTGLSFVPLGSDTEEAMVVITWTGDKDAPALAGDTVGIGGSTSVFDEETGLRYYIRGVVNLDTADLAQSMIEHGRDEVRAVIMHELAHVVGLDHVDDRNELMHSKNVGKTEFGPGDREGLRRLGEGPCLGQDS